MPGTKRKKCHSEDPGLGDESQDGNRMTVQVSLRSIVHENQHAVLLPLLEKHVHIVSKISFLASKLFALHVHRMCEEKQPKDFFRCPIDQTFIDHCFQLVRMIGKKPTKQLQKIKQDHPDLLDTYQSTFLPRLPQSLCSTIANWNERGFTPYVQAARNQLLTCLQNQITTTLYHRIRRYALLRLDEWKDKEDEKEEKASASKVAYQVWSRLQNKEIETKEDPRVQSIVQEIRRHVPDEVTFSDVGIRKNWWSFYPLQWMILRYLEETQTKCKNSNTPIPKGCRLFPLVAQFQLRPMHIPIQPTTLTKCIVPRLPEAKELAKQTKEEIWVRLFRLHPLISSNATSSPTSQTKTPIHCPKRFNFATLVTTDGISASIHLERKNPNTESKSCNQVQPKKRQKADPEERLKGRVIWGLDPGRKDVYTAVNIGQYESLDMFQRHYAEKKHHQVVSFSTKHYHRLLKRTPTPYTDKRLKTNNTLLETPSHKTSHISAFIGHLKYVFAHWNTYERLYFTSKKWRREKRTRRISRQTTMDELCKPFLRTKTTDKKPIVVFGDGGFSSTSRGHASGPVKALRHLLKCKFRDRVECVDISEYNTSKRCSTCSACLVSPKDASSPYRFDHLSDGYRVRLCLQCSRSRARLWNRDTNASRNMLRLFVVTEVKGERPAEFLRDSKRVPTPASSEELRE